MSDNPVGRPTVFTPEKLALLKYAFSIGATDEEAAASAQIATATLYNYQNANPDFLEEKNKLKNNPILQAKSMVVENLKEDLKNAQWYLERKAPNEFGAAKLPPTTQTNIYGDVSIAQTMGMSDEQIEARIAQIRARTTAIDGGEVATEIS